MPAIFSCLMRRAVLAVSLAMPLLTLSALTSPALAQNADPLPDYIIAQYGHPPEVPQGALQVDLQNALHVLVANGVNQSRWEPDDNSAMKAVAQSQDPRLAWVMTDLMRFSWRPDFREALTDVAASVLGIELKTIRQLSEITDQLIAWDIPAYPGYLDHKRIIYTNYLDGMEKLFVEGDIDWPQVAWGGVNIDNRPYDSTDDVCDCIPAADNPEVSDVASATWLKDSDVVFGIEVNGEHRAYPRRIMEVREMVNDSLGGRHLGIPYCTLCGAAQAYFTDGLPEGIERPILRTSGLLIRSNKVMYDLKTHSVFDTFQGKAVTGPLAERGLHLKPVTVITTDWGTWRQAHPDTTVLVERLALGRDFDLRNTRDAKGPIFPVGDVDPRLDVHEDVLGVTTPSGKRVAFPTARAIAALRDGQRVRYGGATLVLAAGGLKAVDEAGADLGSHQAFWFAWSQFHPDTALWQGGPL